jgi:hypothetical protein
MNKLNFNGIDDYVEVPEGRSLFKAGRFFPRTLSYEEVKMLYEGKVKPLKCRRCNFYFMSRSELMYHIWSFHRRK